LTGALDIFLSGHEHQDIALRTGQVDLQYLLDRRVDVIVAGGFAVENLDWERSTGDCECRGVTEEA
jgi:hypothetical protein